MYSGQDLINVISDCSTTIDNCIHDLASKAKTKAKAEMDYRIKLAQKILTERDKGTKATNMSDICRGDKVIATLKYDRDVAESMYDVVYQKIYALKLELSLLDKQYRIEYGNTKWGNERG